MFVTSAMGQDRGGGMMRTYHALHPERSNVLVDFYNATAKIFINCNFRLMSYQS
jgi:hypothetical protein